MSELTRVTVMLCCNRPRDGSFTGKVDRIDVTATPTDIAAELEGKEMACRFDLKLWRVFLGGAPFPIKGYRQWVGNWCWDAVGMEPNSACRLLEYLRGRDWDLMGGYETLWKPWKEGKTLEPWMLAGDELGMEVGG